MSEEEQEEQEETGWSEHWLVFGQVSEAAQKVVEAVNGRVIRLAGIRASAPHLYGVCLLYAENDNEQGFNYYTDDGEKTRALFVCSPDHHEHLYICRKDGSVPRFESSVTELCLISEAEWFAKDEQE
jgi:hypothetical protein